MSMKTGVSGFVYAKVLTDTVTATTYGPIVPVPGLVSVDNKTASSTNTFYADNGPYEVSAALGEITDDVEMADPSNIVIADLLGHTIVAGVMAYKGDDTPAVVAIGFIGLKANGKKRLVWLTKGSFQEPDDSYKTKADKTDPQSQKLSGKFVLRTSDKQWKKVCDEDDPGTLPATIASWFTLPTIVVGA